jgi:hypothetical protein
MSATGTTANAQLALSDGVQTEPFFTMTPVDEDMANSGASTTNT